MRGSPVPQQRRIGWVMGIDSARVAASIARPYRSATGQARGWNQWAFVVQPRTEVLADMKAKSTPWYLWPFVALLRLLTWILGLTGRLVAGVLGVVLMIAGGVGSLTLVCALGGV